ncbi:transposase [Streptomyces sp. NPDC050534]|uniref:transposase n=1 Tax=Streptomyces sp. NPDC050534 TaxID=3365625 RepID=UPI0037B7FE80
MTIQQPSEAVMPRSYPPEFRRKVLDVVASGRKVAEIARLLGISDQMLHRRASTAAVCSVQWGIIVQVGKRAPGPG